jgi:hypothetical protein
MTCLRCGGVRMFRRVGVQTDLLMCLRCDRPERFAQTVDAVGRSLVKRPCEICGATAAARGPGGADPKCGDHWNPEDQP